MSSNGKLYIKEDISDWRDEAMTEEIDIGSEEDLVDAITKGGSTAKIARATVVSRELNRCPSDIIRPNKMLLMTGAMAEIAQKFRAKTMTEFRTANGKSHPIPSFIGKGNQELPTEEEKQQGIEAEPSFVEIATDDGIERNIRYLEKTVTGWIWNRLAQLKVAGADVRLAAENLKSSIDEMVLRIEG